MLIFKLAIISMLGAVAMGLSCHSLDRYTNVVDVKHHQRFCYSIYNPAESSSAHGGQSIHPSRAAKMWHVTSNKDCELQKMNAFGEKYNVYVCTCFANMCNYPFSYYEFKARNYTIAPDYYNLVNGALL
ncbi:Protein CBG23761 [Caenorhabditis briggsae]|uniref:Uncharacterized protein n=2 Tax=Caenorhabditis briggsae TaxID=6238 RepID=A0AAE9CY26_CAEBR|nr:Protein CBG23761 [Caenorhabditis briggsae]ULT85356.1 hypothetical protein L3Y34_013876 [Caenorhabditis briggsae]CAP20527.1 Protein CBG23761 [Caenorhabditis briggsae]